MKAKISNHFTSLAPRLTGTQSAKEVRGVTPHTEIGDEAAPKPIGALLWRGMRQRCPHCGQGPIFRGWIKMHDRCSVCGLQYLPNQGDLLAFQMVINKGLFIFPLIVLMYFRLYVPDVRWFYLLASVLLIVFVGTLPHRSGMALAVDYLVRRKSGDLSETKTQPEASDVARTSATPVKEQIKPIVDSPAPSGTGPPHRLGPIPSRELAHHASIRRPFKAPRASPA